MRDIKFRAWDKKRKKYYPVSGIYFDNKKISKIMAKIKGPDKEGLCECKLYEIDEVILEEYAGLKDIGDKIDIYQNDIVSAEIAGKIQTFVVKWSKYHCSYWLYSKNGILFDSHLSKYLVYLLKLKVIGNMNENPELLTEKKYCFCDGSGMYEDPHHGAPCTCPCGGKGER